MEKIHRFLYRLEAFILGYVQRLLLKAKAYGLVLVHVVVFQNFNGRHIHRTQEFGCVTDVSFRIVISRYQHHAEPDVNVKINELFDIIIDECAALPGKFCMQAIVARHLKIDEEEINVWRNFFNGLPRYMQGGFHRHVYLLIFQQLQKVYKAVGILHKGIAAAEGDPAAG